MSNAPALTTRPLFARGRVLMSRPPSYRRADAFQIRINDGTLGHTRTLSVGDIVQARAFNGTSTVDNHWQVVSYDDPGASAGYFLYDVVRVNGSAASFPAGTPLTLQASAGVGQNFISLSADGQIGASPNITIGRYSSTPWASPTVLARLGNLNGSYGLITDTIGVGIGDYASGDYLRYDTSGGLQISAGGGTVKIESGSVNISATGSPRFTLRNGVDDYYSRIVGTSGASWSLLAWTTGFIDIHADDYLAFESDTRFGFSFKRGKYSSGTYFTGLNIDLDGKGTIYNGLEITNGGLFTNVATRTGAGTINALESTVVCNSATPFTLALPAAIVGRQYVVKNIGAGAVTLDGAGADTIDGALTISLAQWDAVTVQCSAANTWVIV